MRANLNFFLCRFQGLLEVQGSSMFQFDVICPGVSTSLRVALQRSLRSTHFGPATWVSPDHMLPPNSLSHGRIEVASERITTGRDESISLSQRQPAGVSFIVACMRQPLCNAKQMSSLIWGDRFMWACLRLLLLDSLFYCCLR